MNHGQHNQAIVPQLLKGRQLEAYHQAGFVRLQGVLLPDEVSAMRERF